MAKGTHRDKRREAQWRRAIRRQQRSGLTIRAFCREHDLRETAFYFWRVELARREAEQEQRHQAARPRRVARRAKRPSFVPVELAASSADQADQQLGRQADGRIEIVLSGGRQIHVAAPVNRQALADVLAVLEGRPC
jgi:transposase